MNALPKNPLRYTAAWAVHLFTASAATLGVYTLEMIHKHQYTMALWLMAATVFIDAVDGSFARLVNVKKVTPQIDGTLLDNIVDYVNYVITPCFFLLVKPEMLPVSYKMVLIAAISIASAYQFCQDGAKTPDHFFKGFPCYWNITVFYMFIFNSPPLVNALVLSVFSLLIFVPLKYVYPSRLEYVTDSKWLKVIMHGCSGLFGLSSAMMLLTYPNTNTLSIALSLSYILLYLVLGFYLSYTSRFKRK